MTREWNARSYDSLPLPHLAWGTRVLDRLAVFGLAPDARVLDAGCGTGRDAAAALARWPLLELVLLDGSSTMLATARSKLGDAVSYVRADLMQPLPVAPPVDAVMSVAAFHWVPSHPTLFSHLAEVMKPGAPLVTDCGGLGNIARVNVTVAEVLGTSSAESGSGPWEFAGVLETSDRLRAAGFEPLQVRLRRDPFRCEDPDVLEEYLATVVLGAHLDQLPPSEHAPFVRAVRLALPEPEVDYVRLEIDAVRR